MKGEEILMNDSNMKIPTFKELEQIFFSLLSNIFVEEFVDFLHTDGRKDHGTSGQKSVSA